MRIDRWDALSIYARIQPGVDVHGFGMPLIIATLPNSIALNNYLIELQIRGLDKDNDFRKELRNLVTNKHAAAEIEERLGANKVEGNKEYEGVKQKALNAVGALIFVMSPPKDKSNIQGVAGP